MGCCVSHTGASSTNGDVVVIDPVVPPDANPLRPGSVTPPVSPSRDLPLRPPSPPSIVNDSRGETVVLSQGRPHISETPHVAAPQSPVKKTSSPREKAKADAVGPPSEGPTAPCYRRGSSVTGLRRMSLASKEPTSPRRSTHSSEEPTSPRRSTHSSEEPTSEPPSLLQAKAPPLQHKNVVRGYDCDGNKSVNEYTFEDILGSGAFSKVKLGVNQRTGVSYAVKIMNKERLSRKIRGKGVSELQYAMREIEIMKTVHHPNLVRLHEVLNSEDSAKLYLVLEYVKQGPVCRTPTLAYVDHESSASSYDPSHMRDVAKVRSYVHDMLCALNFLHAKNIMHRDIKPENVLLDEHGSCKLADFGVSCLLDKEIDLVTTRDGTPLFFSPEMVHGKVYHGKPNDVWALGITVYILAFDRVPFTLESLPMLVQAIDTREICCPPCAPPLLHDFIYRLLTKEPSLRMTVAQAMGHPFVSPERVQFSLSVRVWKEAKVHRMTDDEIHNASANTVLFKDTTDVSHKSIVEKEKTFGAVIFPLALSPRRNDLSPKNGFEFKSVCASSNASSVNSLEASPEPTEAKSTTRKKTIEPIILDESSSIMDLDQSGTLAKTKDGPPTPLTELRRKRRSMINVFHDGANVDGYGMTNNAVYGMQTVAGSATKATKRAFPPPPEGETAHEEHVAQMGSERDE